MAASRDSAGVELIAVGPQGTVVIKAGKIVVIAPPLPGSLGAFAVDSTESGVFGKFTYGSHYTARVQLPGVPDSTNVANIGADTQYNIAPLPSIYGISPSDIPGYFKVKFGGKQNLLILLWFAEMRSWVA